MRSFEGEIPILTIVSGNVDLLKKTIEITAMTHARLLKTNLKVSTKMQNEEMRDS